MISFSNTLDEKIPDVKVVWDDLDTFYLANMLSIGQLQSAIVSAKRWYPFEDWHTDFIEHCTEAIKWIRASQPKPTIKPGSKFVDIESLKRNSDIVSIVEHYTHLTKSGRNFKGVCPFHSEKTPSFMVYPDQQTYHCFGACNTGGDVISFLMKVHNTDFKGAVAILGGK